MDLEAQAGAHPRLKRVFGSVPGVRWLVGAFVAVALGAAIVARLIASVDFPTFGEALWWSIQTVTTVGYGDVVPQDTAGRVIAAVLMLSGIGFLTVVTAVVTAAFLESVRRRLGDPGHAEVLAKLDDLDARLQALEAALRR